MPKGFLALIVVLVAASVWWFGLRGGDTPGHTVGDEPPATDVTPEEQATASGEVPDKAPELDAASAPHPVPLGSAPGEGEANRARPRCTGAALRR